MNELQEYKEALKHAEQIAKLKLPTSALLHSYLVGLAGEIQYQLWIREDKEGES